MVARPTPNEAEILGPNDILVTPYSDAVIRAAQAATLRSWPGHTLRDEANAIAVYAFRNTFIEDLHAGGRITDREMKSLMIQASASLAHWLFLRDKCAKTFPKRYYAEVALQARMTTNWERGALTWEVPDDDYVACSRCQRQIPIGTWRFCPDCGTKSPAPASVAPTDGHDATET